MEQKFTLIVLEAGKYKIWALAKWVPEDSSLPGLQTYPVDLSSSCSREQAKELLGVSGKNTDPIKLIGLKAKIG